MANKQGDFIWYELLTSDADTAQDFYAKITGWTYADSGQTGMDYRIVNKGENSVGGLMPITPAMADHGARPMWLGYIAVDDVDASVEGITGMGGSVWMQATDIPNVGRIAMVTDPGGAPFYFMKPASSEGESLAFSYDVPREGHCAWNELMTPDQDLAWAFYGKHFGWTKDGAMEMGPEMGTYDFVRHGEFVLGAMMKASPEWGPPRWNQYFRVPDIDAAKAIVEANGGAITNGPMEIPGGEYAMNCIDPQGAHFGLVGKRV